MPSPISILVVDDSAFMRKMVTEMLSEDPDLCVVGQARDGEDALRKLPLLRPDVVTLDVEMPQMDGLAALEQIMLRQPTPTIMLSSLTQAGAEMTMRCLEQGAVDFVGKPSGSISLNIRVVAAELIAKVKAAAGVRVSRLASTGVHSPKLIPRAAPKGPVSEGRFDRVPVPEAMTSPADVRPSRPLDLPSGRAAFPGVLLIGSSTGGPRALQTLIPMLPENLHVPIVIVQHMPPGFTASLAARLDGLSPYSVREAAVGDSLTPGVVLVAPGGRHLQFESQGQVLLSEEPPIHGVRPAIDVTLASLTRIYGGKTAAVLLTGMGKDGARGLKTVRDLGGATLAEDESTCVVYGMPKAAVELRAVEYLLPLPQIGEAIGRVFTEARKITR